MSGTKKVALVTGANQGIGLGVVRGLCKIFDGDVLLGSRDPAKGEAAVKELEKEGLHPKFCQIDILDDSTIKKCRSFLMEQYGGLDVLVNNAGIAYKRDATASDAEQAKNTLGTNFFGTVNVCKELLPLIRDHGRVVNVSSVCGCLRNIPNQAIQEKFRSLATSGTLESLEAMMKEYVCKVEAGDDWKNEGWGNSHYGISKAGTTAATMIMARNFQKMFPDRKDVLINCCCPGYVSTNMSSYKGQKTIDQGAETPVYLATLAPDNPSNPNGQFLSDKQVKEW